MHQAVHTQLAAQRIHMDWAILSAEDAIELHKHF